MPVDGWPAGGKYVSDVIYGYMIRSVDLLQIIEKNMEFFISVSREIEAEIADTSNLKQNEIDSGVHLAPSEEKVGRLVDLQTRHARVYAEIGIETVLGRYGGEHNRVVTLA